MNIKKYILTGGPNSGKSSLIELISKRGQLVLEESSRMLIQAENIFPWDNQEIFCEACRQLQVKRERGLVGNVAFLDRSLVDPIAFAEVAQCPISDSIYQDINNANYEQDVFFLQMLPEYRTDAQRKDSPDQAVAVSRQLREVYMRLGFRLIDVPLFSDNELESINMRLQFILGHAT